jgi:hypothetical protein
MTGCCTKSWRWPRISADELDRAMDVAAEQMIQAARGHADPRLRAALEVHPALDSLRPRPQ